ncbi:hypothetical protein BC939DRAFT_502712 [Gamsiella multidivaricata]|uniref:uncharacterized protein n=1 Tax=Gamsiella multidivaricata TaxID=101098 RepID=UPI0022207911|nr:uncharacterized protein BC939DRAFT_502712 [Gamsiella multidivaricata]KAI7824738.1 hypothetical protein BC939DRAFT_502712 [Gamsiella multidivaricata]
MTIKGSPADMKITSSHIYINIIKETQKAKRFWQTVRGRISSADLAPVLATLTPIKKSAKKRKQKPKSILNPSSRRARAIPSETAGTGASKSRNQAVLMDTVLSANFETVVLNYDTLSTQLRTDLSEVMGADGAERDQFHKHVIHAVQEIVRAATDTVGCTQQAIVAYIDAVTAEEQLGNLGTYTVVGVDPGVRKIATAIVISTADRSLAKKVLASQGLHTYAKIPQGEEKG